MFFFGRVPQRQWQCVGRVAVSRVPLAVGLSGAPLRSGAPLHSAPSPSNPSRATAVYMAPPFSGVSLSSAIASECATSCLSRQPHEPKLSATAAAFRSTAGDFTARHSAPLRNLRRQPHPALSLPGSKYHSTLFFVKIGIQKAFGQAVRSDVLPCLLGRKPLIGVDLSIGRKLAVIIYKCREIAH